MYFWKYVLVEGLTVSPCAASMPEVLLHLDILQAHAFSSLLCTPQVDPTSLFNPFSADGFNAANIFPLPTGSSSSGGIASSSSSTNGQSGEVATWGPSTGNQIHVQRWTLPVSSSSIHSSEATRRAGKITNILVAAHTLFCFGVAV